MTIREAIQEYDNFRGRERQTDPLPLIDNPLLRRIGEKADTLGLECYVVGGYVRDIILERPSKDIDCVVASPPTPLPQERGDNSCPLPSPTGEGSGVRLLPRARR